MSANDLFDMLVDRYRSDHPPDLTGPEFDDWKEKLLLPTQRLVLAIFTMWLQDHRLLEEEPHIAKRLTDFLDLIVAPAPLASAAKLIIQTVERLVSFLPIYPCVHYMILFFHRHLPTPPNCPLSSLLENAGNPGRTGMTCYDSIQRTLLSN